jgi:hypothetical protein
VYLNQYYHQNLNHEFTGSQRTMYKIELWLRSGNVEIADRIKVRMLDALSDGEASKPNSRVKMPEFEYNRRRANIK